MLFEVAFVNESMVSEWEFEVSAGYRVSLDPHSWQRHTKRRRAKATKLGGSAEMANVRGSLDSVAKAQHWYTKWYSLALSESASGGYTRKRARSKIMRVINLSMYI